MAIKTKYVLLFYFDRYLCYLLAMIHVFEEIIYCKNVPSMTFADIMLVRIGNPYSHRPFSSTHVDASGRKREKY